MFCGFTDLDNRAPFDADVTEEVFNWINRIYVIFFDICAGVGFVTSLFALITTYHFRHLP